MANLPLFAALLLLPLFVTDYWLFQLALYLLYAAAAVGLGLCWGQVGFLPLGQAVFFGIAAYASGLLLTGLDGGAAALILLPLIALASGLLAFGIGMLVFRRSGESGPYFSLITLALSLLAFQIAQSWRSVTGGFNGLAGIPGLPGMDGFLANYYLAASGLILVVATGAWLLAAPIGILWRAIAQNERRVVLLGFNANLLKALAFGVSGFFAGIGGVLYAPQQGLVSPQVVGFILSAELLIWTAVGGRGRLWGPVLGTLLIGTLTAELRDSFFWWEVMMALFFMLVVLAFPQGLIGLVAAPMEAIGRRLVPARAAPAAIPAPPLPSPAGTPSLALDKVVVQLGKVRILDELSVELPGPGIVCVIGPNGAGKTTTFNVLTGELPVAGGRVLLDGEAIHGLPPHRIMRRGFARKLQIPSVFPELGIADNLALALWSSRARPLDLLRPSLRRWTSPVVQELAERYPFLGEGRIPARTLSHGQRQILELAMALAAEPRILLLDEPCAGLSPEETAQVIDVVRWAAGRLRGTVVVIEHDMSLVKELADTVVVLHEGRRLAEGALAEVQADETVRAVYVGSRK